MTDKISKEISNLIENSNNAFVSSVDQNGFPNTKAMFALYHEG